MGHFTWPIFPQYLQNHPIQAILVSMTDQDQIQYDANAHQLRCQGEWDLAHLPHLQLILGSLSWPTQGELVTDGSGIKKMDSAGAWILTQWRDKLKQQGINVDFQHFAKEQQNLISLIQHQLETEGTLPKVTPLPWLGKIGKVTIDYLAQFQKYLAFVGQLSLEALRLVGHPSHWRFPALATVVYRNGYQALPIIALLSLMIGVVMTYQMGLQLRNYGANIYIVDLLGLSILREFGPLLTAIMVAGRTGSAFTAQLGIMKINQEIDAMDTMGVTSAEILLLPRILGLFIALPLLTVWSDVFGVIGGMMMSNNMLGITWYDFLHRFPQVIPLKTFLLGLGKAPVFALIIASVGCFQGIQVKQNADSVGQNTTKSVVLAIFFIIVADAFFSVLFSKLKL